MDYESHPNEPPQNTEKEPQSLEDFYSMPRKISSFHSSHLILLILPLPVYRTLQRW